MCCPTHTGLRSLSIQACYGGVDACLCTISGLAQLTSLHLDCVQQLSLLQHLPTQLQQLTVNYIPEEGIDGAGTVGTTVNLCHLCALTRLDLDAEFHALKLQPDSQLPGSLREVSLSSCTDPTALLGLTNAETLSIDDCGLSVCAMGRLCEALTQLTAVHLMYPHGPYNVAAPVLNTWDAARLAVGWSALPLK